LTRAEHWVGDRTFDQRIPLRFNQNALKRGLVEIFEGGEHWQAPIELPARAYMY
jgi:hypothetical protein